ncbi:MAG: type III-B CRISPR module RAMP protein Cmr1 [bacterium]
MLKALVAKLRTLVPIWTGDVDRRSDLVKETGLVGSLRWWYEALVRGLGGYSCDPTENDRCTFDDGAYASGGSEDGLRDVCPACRLFGCTGWSAKFRFLVGDQKGGMDPVNLNSPNAAFQFKFVELKPLLKEERWLLQKTLWLIDKYGSIGGRMTLKPPRMPDYGLVKVIENLPNTNGKLDRRGIEAWLEEILERSPTMQRKLEAMPHEYPDLRYFFFNPGYWLDMQKMNQLVKADPSGFMAGERGVSKKVFSFRDGKRFWGYTSDDDMLDAILDELESMGVRGTITGEEVLDEL